MSCGKKLSKILLWAFVFCAFGSASLSAQQERFYNWYFGNQAGLNFSSGSPVALTNGAMSTTEGCASISDASGNLMFYTNGINVWNANHIIMTNGSGLTGHNSSTQSAIIIQKPLSTNIYYVFTADADAGPNGIRYSEIDMALSGGLGAVTANKNILLQTPSCEKITAVRHCNNRDVWVVSHDWNSSQFRVWLVTPTGVNTTPVLSSTGSVISGITQSGYGQLKANPDGNKLLAGYYGFGGTNGVNKFELYDFNNSTGVVSTGFALATETGAYGCEFSPHGRVAYGATNQGRLVQFDLCAGSNTAIQNSKVVLGVLGPFIGSLQLGPDGKIYISRNTSSLSVINNPNTVGMGCNFVNAAISLAGRTSSMGLPNLASFYIRPDINPFTYAANCTTVNFTSPTATTSTNSCANASNAIVSASWNFGDPASGASNTSTHLNPTHVFSGTGTYNVQLILNLGCYNDTLVQPVNITGFNVNTSATPASCGSSNGTATATPAVAGSYTYLWSNGATGQTATGLASGLYSVTVTSSTGCTATASVNVSSSGSVSLSVNTSNVLCNGGTTGSATASASGGAAPYTYSWSNGASGATANGLAAGNYSVTMTDNGGCSTTQNFTITQPAALSATATAAPASCSSPTGSASVTVSGGTAPYSYLWSDGSTGSNASGLSTGSHTVTVTDANGCTVTRTVNVVQPAALSGSAISTPATCNGAANGTASASVTGGTAPLSYSWSNGGTTATIGSLAAGAYTVTVTDASGCTILLNTTVSQPSALSATVNVNPAACGTGGGSATVSASGGTSPYSYSWSSGSTSAAATGLSSGNYSVTVTDASGCQTSSNFTVTQPSAITIALSATGVTCNGAANG
ncbi:MAG: PKD domain-containing protein [Bacteroidia bacterium]